VGLCWIGPYVATYVRVHVNYGMRDREWKCRHVYLQSGVKMSEKHLSPSLLFASIFCYQLIILLNIILVVDIGPKSLYSWPKPKTVLLLWMFQLLYVGTYPILYKNKNLLLFLSTPFALISKDFRTFPL